MCFNHHFHRLTEVREALLVLYLKSDSSKFHHLLGFTNVPAVNEDEYRPDDADEVLVDLENHEENRQFDTQTQDNHCIY